MTLRQDNADIRLTQIGYDLGLVDEDRYKKFLYRKENIEKELDRVRSIRINPTEENNNIIRKLNSTELKNSLTLAELLRRPELNYEKLADLDKDRPKLRKDIIDNVEIEIKYEGYIKKQEIQIRQYKKLENRVLSKDLDYKKIDGLRLEAREKLSDIRPESIGQAGRITGVSPADINVLLIYLESQRRRHDA